MRTTQHSHAKEVFSGESVSGVLSDCHDLNVVIGPALQVSSADKALAGQMESAVVPLPVRAEGWGWIQLQTSPADSILATQAAFLAGENFDEEESEDEQLEAERTPFISGADRNSHRRIRMRRLVDRIEQEELELTALRPASLKGFRTLLLPEKRLLQNLFNPKL